VQSAFTPKEAGELLRLKSAKPVVAAEDLRLDPASEAALAELGERSREGKNLGHLRSFANDPAEVNGTRIHFSFLRSPVEILGDMTGHVSGLKLRKNRLEKGEGDYIQAVPTDEFETLDVGTVFSAIGFRGSPIEGLPFDDKRGLIPNREGRIYDPQTDSQVPGAYVVGWARSGPKGLIGIHKAASAEVVKAMLEDFQPAAPLAERDAIVEVLAQRNLQVISFDDWKILDAHEIERGKERGAPRDKVTQIDEMLATIKNGQNSDAS
jgi:ferredoxin--NADP+ reductase